MRTISRLYPFFLILSLLAYSCASIEPVRFTGIKDVGIAGTDKNGMTLRIKLGVENPNNMKIKIRKADLDVLINNRKIGNLDLKKPVVIQKRSNESIELEVVVKGDEILKSGAGAILSTLFSQKIQLRLKGEVKARAYGIGKRIPVDQTHDVKLPSLR